MDTLFPGEGYRSPSEFGFQSKGHSAETLHSNVHTNAMKVLSPEEQRKQSFTKGQMLAKSIIGAGSVPGKGDKMVIERSDLTTVPNRESFIEGMNHIFELAKSQAIALQLIDAVSQPGKLIWKIVVTSREQQVEV